MAIKELTVLFQELEHSEINKQHMKIIIASLLGCMLEFFDFFIVAFVLAFIVTPWKLTFGQSAIVLWSAGLGAVIGGFFFGWIADHIGRRPTMIATVLTFSLPTGLLYFTPEGNWIFFSICRFVVGLGVGGLVSVDLPVLQEFVPSRYRGAITGIVLSSVTVGVLIASLAAGYLSPMIGWRGLFIVGLAPALFTLVIRVWIPESPRWLISQGRYADAKKNIGWVLGYKAEDVAGRPQGGENVRELAQSPKVRWIEIFNYPRSLIVSWLVQFGGQTVGQGFILWGVTILVLLLGVSPARAAKLYFFVTLGGLAGRYFWAFTSDYIGRRKAGFLVGLGGGSLLIIAANCYRLYWGSVPLLWILMIAIGFFTDGGFAVIGPYASEPWPRHLRGSGHGSAYGFGGLGKILGPMVLALFAGTSNIVKPEATLDAVFPAFLFFGFTCYGVAITFLCGYETGRKSLEEIEYMITRKKPELATAPIANKVV